MPKVQVIRVKRRTNYSQLNAPWKFYLRQKPQSAKMYNNRKIAKRIQANSSLKAVDVNAVMEAFTEELREILVEGHKVKVDGLGTFYTTISSMGVETEKECSVKNIRRVNIRFRVDNTLRLVNDANASSRAGENNISYELVDITMMASDIKDDDDDDDDDDDNGGEDVDPNA